MSTSMSYAVAAEVLLPGNALVLAPEARYVTETETGLEFALDTPIEVWGELTERLLRQEQRIHWAIADALIFGERYGEDYSQWVEETGLREKTLINIASVGRRVDRSRRREGVSFSHHEIVAKLPPQEQKDYLDLAVERGMSCYDLRQKVKADQEAKLGRATDEDAPLPLSAADLTDEAKAALDYRAAGVGKAHRTGFERGFVAALLWLEAQDCFTREIPS